ncbi:MAG: 3-hydroxybutyryl-CoA dehydrogenase [Syntrophomonadaceae bacterium]|jgi:3-hydroxybutyryl-CoA dehydrogenase|nr:3-hydroxybutyryl-CoA dehydrogenase [Syntrophomonadaceae bacterium]
MDIKKIGVLGAGIMGSGIAQICAEAGYEVVLVDIAEAFVNKGFQGIVKNWTKAVEKGKRTAEDLEKFKALITTSLDNKDFKDCDVVIEAIVENIDVKKKVFKELGEICKDSAVLATNTSALSITEIGTASGRPQSVVGMHFFNPVPAMKLVEVIPGAETSEETVAIVTELAVRIGKEPVRAKETPGFIVNRLLVPYMNEAAMLYQEGIPAEEIDKAMKLGANMPMGPLALADLVGLDTLLMICDYYWREFGDSKYRASLALRNKVRAGHLGRKTGKGFYDYTK